MNEVWTVYYLTGIYFLIGALGMLIINLRKKEGAFERWKKLFVYALIVFAVESSIAYIRPFPYLCAAILLAGLNEIIFVWRWHPGHRWYNLLLALLFYGAVGYCFYYFSLALSWNAQLFVYMTVLTFDGFSQITGQLIGRTKLASKVSPGKTIEGTIGGLLMALLAAYIVQGLLSYRVSSMLLLAGLTCVAALAGDLLASRYKRLHNVKDYSSLLPGHGGVLDRFDSFIFAGAAWWLAAHYGLLDGF